MIQVLPYIVVLVTALMGINVAVVLFVGILMTGVIGLLRALWTSSPGSRVSAPA